jgi:hypothetical protein
MIVCFLDESGSRDIFTMACVMSTDTKWLRFDKEWRRALAEFRVPYPDFTNDMLDDIEKFLVGLKEHPFQIPEKIAAIRTARLAKN